MLFSIPQLRNAQLKRRQHKIRSRKWGQNSEGVPIAARVCDSPNSSAWKCRLSFCAEWKARCHCTAPCCAMSFTARTDSNALTSELWCVQLRLGPYHSCLGSTCEMPVSQPIGAFDVCRMRMSFCSDFQRVQLKNHPFGSQHYSTPQKPGILE